MSDVTDEQRWLLHDATTTHAAGFSGTKWFWQRKNRVQTCIRACDKRA
jgi:hypothetical protein